jgi:hypothetical protein
VWAGNARGRIAKPPAPRQALKTTGPVPIAPTRRAASHDASPCFGWSAVDDLPQGSAQKMSARQPYEGCRGREKTPSGGRTTAEKGRAGEFTSGGQTGMIVNDPVGRSLDRSLPAGEPSTCQVRCSPAGFLSLSYHCLSGALSPSLSDLVPSILTVLCKAIGRKQEFENPYRLTWLKSMIGVAIGIQLGRRRGGAPFQAGLNEFRCDVLHGSDSSAWSCRFTCRCALSSRLSHVPAFSRQRRAASCSPAAPPRARGRGNARRPPPTIRLPRRPS